MARNLEFYKGSRKKRNYALIPFVIGLGLITLLVVLFYGMQKYAVISKDGVEVVLPGMKREVATTVDSQGHTVRVFDEVPTTLVFDAPDYSRVAATAGKNLQPVRAIYIAAEDINEDNLLEKAGRLNDGNALMLEMKPRSGALVWTSKSSLALNYGLYYQSQLTDSIPSLIDKVKSYGTENEKDIYMVAEVCCCIDSLLPARSLNFALKSAYGVDYKDDKGTYLDPYNPELRNYIVELVQELYEMGFDEVVLRDVVHPVQQTPEGQEPFQFVYSSEMSTTPNPVNAVCGFAIYVANALADRDPSKRLSIYVDTPRSLVRADEGTGQDQTLFMKIYDRVYYRTDMYTFTYNLQDIENSHSVVIGDMHDRFVPVVINYLPKNSSWIYIEDLPNA